MFRSIPSAEQLTQKCDEHSKSVSVKDLSVSPDIQNIPSSVVRVQFKFLIQWDPILTAHK